MSLIPRHFLPLAFLAASLPLVPAMASAQAEITYPAPAADLSLNAVAPDGRHWVATLAGGSSTTPAELTVLRQVSDVTSQPWAEVARFSTEGLPAYHYRIKAGKSTMWIAWQGEPTAGNTRKIQIRQIYPTVGAPETVAGSEDQSSGFDFAVDGNERPCVVSYKTTTPQTPNLIPHIRLHRRGVSGGWEHILAVSYDEEIIAKPEEVAIAANGTTLHVFDVAWAQITYSGNILRQSTLYHAEIKAPGTLINSQSLSYQVANETSNVAQGLRRPIANVSATTGPDGTTAVSYSHLGSKQLKYGYKPPTSRWAVETLPQPSGDITAQYLDESTVRISPSGLPAVVWRSTDAGDVSRAVRQNGNWTTRPAYGLKLARPTVTLDAVGNPHYTGMEMGAPNRVVAARPRDITDEDGNGFTAILESAFLMSPGSLANAPSQMIVTVDGKRYPAIRYLSSPDAASAPANPFTNGGFLYTVEISRDLFTWSTAAADLVHYSTDAEHPEHTSSVWRSAVSLDENPKQFLRMRVTRPE